MNIDSTVFTCYKSNDDSAYIQADDGPIWDMGNSVGDFVTDVSTWLDGDWEPGAHSGQILAAPDGLTPVATWSANDGLQLLVERDQLGGTAGEYISDHKHQ